MNIDKKGFSLVELAIALGLVSVLISVVTAGGGMMAKSRVHREMVAVDNLRIAAQNYLSSQNMTYSDINISDMKKAGLLPANFDPLKANSFGGDYIVSANPQDNTKVDIALANIPETAGADLSNIFKSKAETTSYDKSSQVWQVTF